MASYEERVESVRKKIIPLINLPDTTKADEGQYKNKITTKLFFSSN